MTRRRDPHDVVAHRRARLKGLEHGYAAERTAVSAGPFTMLLHPDVFHPASRISEIMIEATTVRPGDEVLDVGCGTGILGITALYRGAGHVTFLDISRKAVANTRDNLRFHRLGDRAEVYRSDLFAAVQGRRFDRILFNSPFLYTATSYDDIPIDLSRELKQSFFDPGYALCKRFFSEVRRHLKKGGMVQFCSNSVANRPLLDATLREHGLRRRTLKRMMNVPGVLADSIDWFVYGITVA